MTFPQQVTEQQAYDALAALGIEWRGAHVQSVTLGVNTVTVVTTARDDEGRPFLSSDGDGLATHVHSIAIRRPGGPHA